jgi:hypothetical protein
MEIFLLVVIAAVAWLFLDGLKAREVAIAAARRACEAEDLQFLDETVESSGLKPQRDAAGRVRLRRVHAFEFSDSGNNRLKGSVVTLGHEVVTVNVGWRPSGNVWRIH